MFRKMTSFFTLAVYTFSVLWTPYGQANGFYRPQMKEVFDVYTQTAKLVQKTGKLEIFNKVFGIEGENAQFVTSHLTEGVPEIKLNKSVIEIPVEGGPSIKIQVVNLDKSEFRINGLKFVYDPSDSLAQTAEKLKPLATSKGFGLINGVWERIMPSANAMAPLLMIGLAIAAVVVVAMLVKGRKDKQKTERLALRHDHEQRMTELGIEERNAANQRRIDRRAARAGDGDSVTDDHVADDEIYD